MSARLVLRENGAMKMIAFGTLFYTHTEHRAEAVESQGEEEII
jgi:hypothetical protein